MMKPNEMKVMDLLNQTHQAFLDLPIQHPDDQKEWCACVHELQRMLMARVAVRDHPDKFINIERQ